MLSRTTIHRDIAAVLECSPEELSEDTNLQDAGMDSLRLMTLVEEWRADGHDIDYYEVFSLSTVGELDSYLENRE